MKCFVATAFDWTDVDKIYDKAIKPVLRKLEMQPLRVDRVEHNEDIDDKIFELLDDADFCIADLTYARPSVYYEAGYAYGKGQPVIYTARSDHFHHDRKNDPQGNLKIHFDLQMKNIIPWTEPNEVFRKKLRKRINHVTGPMRRAAAKAQNEHQHFSGLSQIQQLVTLVDKATTLLSARKFRLAPDNLSGMRGMLRRVRMMREPGPGHLQILNFMAVPRISKDLFSSLQILKTDPIRLFFIDHLFLIASLDRAQPRVLARGLPHYEPVQDRILVHDRMKTTDREKTVFAVIDGIKSEEGFVEEFRHRMDQIGIVEAPKWSRGQKMKK